MSYERFELIRNTPGSADGRCLACGAVITVYGPKEMPAVEALTKAFDEHYQQKHRDDRVLVFPARAS